MKYNYHAHTVRCNHASGTEREYVEAAISAGLKGFGFSDHSPMIFPEEAGNFYSGHRMRPEQFSDYADTVRSLQKEYRNVIDIRLGVELEYLPKSFSATEAFLKAGGTEYVLLGQHFLGEEFDGKSKYVAGGPFTDPALLTEYTDLVIGQIESEKYLYVAHPDIFRFSGDPEFYQQEAERMCKAALKHNVPLEVNCLGFSDRRNYPNSYFWKMAGSVGCPVIYGIDAHSPRAITEAKNVIARWEELTKGYGLRMVDGPLL